MKMDYLALRTAKTFVASYNQEDDVMEHHQQAIECRDCEAFLQLGIDAFHWVIRADQVARQAIYDGTAEFDQNAFEDAIRLLCREWLKPCDSAMKWVEMQHARNFKVDNFEKFQECCAEMRAIVKYQVSDEEVIPDKIAVLRDIAIKEHLDGHTTEFV